MATAPLAPLVGHIHTLAAGRGVRHRTDRQLLDDFAQRRDETAFAALVSRHGPLVLRVCRRVLGHEQDAEDAFQATFLVLAQKAGAVRWRETVASWLHGVAYRTAMKAKRSAARRRKHESKLMANPPRSSSPTWDDVQAVLDEEIQRLPPCFREAFVLCVLLGKSGREAAAELGCEEGTVKSRVSRARQKLRQQLARRGIDLTALLAALSVAESTGRAALPATLAHAALRFGLLVAAGEPAAGVIPPHVAALAAGVTRAMFPTKARIATLVVFAASLFAAGAGVLTCHALAGKAQQAPPAAKTAAPPAEKAAEAEADWATLSGRVLDPDGKPVAGARVCFVRHRSNRPDGELSPARAITDKDGRFRFRVATAADPTEDYPRSFSATVTAVAAGYGPGWATVYKREALADLTLRLVKDDVPIEGRVVDLEGKPIRGVTVRVMGVTPMAREDLKPWLDALAQKKDERLIAQFRGTTLPPEAAGLTAPVTTDAGGRFRLTGAGRERIVMLRFEGPTIETRYADAMTRPGPTIRIPRDKDYLDFFAEAFQAYHGASFVHAAAPTRPVIGTVTDKDTGRPLTGVVLQARILSSPLSQRDYLRVTTDREGRYRLVGLTGAARHDLEVVPPVGQPYLGAGKAVPAGGGQEPVRMDFELKRGVWITGKVTDKATGKPIRAEVRYFAFADNPHLNDAPGFRRSRPPLVYTAEDGSFTLVGLPGRGAIAARVPRSAQGRYLNGAGAEDIKGAERDGVFRTYPYGLHALGWNRVAEVSPNPGAKSVQCDLPLDPGKTVTGTIVGPDGKPVAGVSIDGSWGSSLQVRSLPTAAFTLPAVNPRKPRPFFFRHRDKQLGAAELIRGDEPKGFSVRLQPTATITGRVVDEDGQPVVGLQLTGKIHAGQLNLDEGWYGFLGGMTDKDGRFHIAGVIPGVKVNLASIKGPRITGALIPEATLRPGETKDFGDLKLKATE